MKEFKYVIKDELGLHARPAGLLVKKSSEFSSKVTVFSGGKEANARQIISLMTLGIKKGAEITCNVEGEDEVEASAALEEFFKENL